MGSRSRQKGNTIEARRRRWDNRPTSVYCTAFIKEPFHVPEHVREDLCLAGRTTDDPYISLRQLDELPIVVINHPLVRAAVALQGAHLLLWQPSGEQPALWLSPSPPSVTASRSVAGYPSAGLGLARRSKRVTRHTASRVTCHGPLAHTTKTPRASPDLYPDGERCLTQVLAT